MRHAILSAVILLLLTPSGASADIALLLAQPYGRAAAMNPTGHVGIYLTRICAASPTKVRRCEIGETGVVISRYHRVAQRDWIAVPLVPYLYGVERAADVPSYADAEHVARIRNAYRRAYLKDLIPDFDGGVDPIGDWTQLVGASYDRKVVAFMLTTTEAQDDSVIRQLNSHNNAARFNLLFRNCADFARDIVNSYFPKALRSSFIADLGVTTPKQIVKSFVRFGERRSDLQLTAFVLPQIPGSRQPSRNVRGVFESFVKAKKYLIPLAFLQPWVPTAMATGYVVRGRFNPDRYAPTIYQPRSLEQRALTAAEWQPHQGVDKNRQIGDNATVTAD